MIITSFFEGRVRLKASIFKNNDISSQLTNVLLLNKAVKNVSVNTITGSMLIEYNPVKISLVKIKKAMPYFEKIKELYEIYGEESVEDILKIIKEMEKLLK